MITRINEKMILKYSLYLLGNKGSFMEPRSLCPFDGTPNSSTCGCTKDHILTGKMQRFICFYYKEKISYESRN